MSDATQTKEPAISEWAKLTDAICSATTWVIFNCEGLNTCVSIGFTPITGVSISLGYWLSATEAEAVRKLFSGRQATVTKGSHGDLRYSLRDDEMDVTFTWSVSVPEPPAPKPEPETVTL